MKLLEIIIFETSNPM